MNRSDDNNRPALYYTAGQAYYYTAGRMCVMSKSGGHFGIDLGMKKSKRDLLDLYFATQCGYGVQWKMKCVS